MTDHDPLVLINAFEGPEGRDDDFIAGWTTACEFLDAQPGYSGRRFTSRSRPALRSAS